MSRGHSNYYDWRNSRYYDSYLSEPRNLFSNMSTLNASAFAIEEYTNRLFYAQGSSIRVVDHNLSKNVTLSPFVRIVIADSRVSKAVQAIAVHGKIIVWSSSELQGLFVGALSKRGTFLSTKNMMVLDGDGDEDMRPRQIVIVETRGRFSSGSVKNIKPSIRVPKKI